MHLFVFRIDEHRLAVPASVVREIVAAVAVTALPAAPAGIAGVIDVRGELAPVYDLRVRFGRSARRLRASEHFILAHVGGRLVALRVDRAEEMIDLPDEEISTPSGESAAFAQLSGVARQADGLVLIQDLEAFLSTEDVRALDEALRAAGTAQPSPAEPAAT